MFAISEAEAAAIRAVYEQRGEFAAAVPWHHRQRAGAGVRPDHRGLAAAATGEADAETAAATSGPLTLVMVLWQHQRTAAVSPLPPPL